MKLRTASLDFCLVLVAAALTQFRGPITNGHVSSKIESAGKRQAANLRVVERYGNLPLSFEANRGQTDSDVKFLSRGNGYSLFLTSTEAVLSLKKPGVRKGPQITQISPIALHSAPSVKSVDEGAVLRMKLVGANPKAEVSGLDELPGKSNYFIGNDPSKWRTNVPTYTKVRYENVYSGIDLVYYGNQRQLEYDFVVAPGADPRAIRLAIEGDETLRIDGQGDLVLEAEGSELRLHQPVIYQEVSGARQRIGGNFVIRGGRQVGFEVARYDTSKLLIIDPVLSYSTYLGGSANDIGFGIAVDSAGNAYVTGATTSINFPITPGAFQTTGGVCFVTKLNAAGSALVYSTFLGGCGGDGSDQDYGNEIAVDSSGNAYVTGFSTSFDFPTANAFQARYGGGRADAFVTKLSADGSALFYSTYLGGSGDDVGQGIAVDSSGNAYVTGLATSFDFPTANAFQPAHAADGGLKDAFVAKFNAAGSALLYSTYIGGGGNDFGFGIAVDSSGNAYVTGQTASSNFPTVNAFQAAIGSSGGNSDAFVTKLNATGSALVYSTYLGGGGGDIGFGIAVDSSGNAYMTGRTSSSNFPTANAFQAAHAAAGTNDAFVTKLNAAGSALVYSTYLGGSGDDIGFGIAVDSSGNAYVTGRTGSTSFPTANAFQAVKDGITDAFVTKLNATGSALVYSTYLGGSGDDYGRGIAVDSSSNAYVTGSTGSTNFPTANVFQAVIKGGITDAFVTKFPAVTAGALPPPQLTQGTAVNGATFQPGMVPGSWAQVKGANLADVTRIWGDADFNNGNNLPTSLNGTQVLVNNLRAAVYFISPAQVSFQVPAGVSGNASVQVLRNDVSSNTVTGAVPASAPGLFGYTIGTKTYPAAVFANSFLVVGDPGVAGSAVRKAVSGDRIQLYATGLTSSPAGVIITTVAGISGVTAMIGAAPANVEFAGLVAVGEYQINILVPNLADGEYPVVIRLNGQDSQAGVIIPVGR